MPCSRDLLGHLQDLVLLPLGIDHPLQRGAGLVEHRLHGHAGAEHPLLQALAVGVQVLDRAGGNTGLRRRLGHRRGDVLHEPGIEGLGDQVFRTETQLRPP